MREVAYKVVNPNAHAMAISIGPCANPMSHQEGLSKNDIKRCRKRFVARKVYRDLTKDLAKLTT